MTFTEDIPFFIEDESPSSGDAIHPLTVSQITRRIKHILETNLYVVWVVGELSNVVIPRSGHLYGLLKDGQAQLRLVMFRSQLSRVKFTPEDGQEVIISGRLTVYEARGEYQLIVDSMEPRGQGALQLAFEQLKKKLAAEGLFDPARKKPLPLYPKKIGIVTSPTGAAIHDILHILNRRFSKVDVLISPSKVQGDAASREIAAALRLLDKRDDIDVIIVGRGGGSIEDLWAFNEEIVARAIFNAQKPIISAVGHETDFTIADFVADTRAPTPSAAAELVVKNKDDLLMQVTTLERRLITTMKHKLGDCDSELQLILQKRIFREPDSFFSEQRMRLDDMMNRLSMIIKTYFDYPSSQLAIFDEKLKRTDPRLNIGHQTANLARIDTYLKKIISSKLESTEQKYSALLEKLETLSPLSHLKRGYALIFKENSGKIVKTMPELEVGEKIHVQFIDGTAFCSVNKTTTLQRWSIGNGKEKNNEL